jgi:aryl-alcohol dehydrogenase
LTCGGEPIHSHFFGQSSFATRALAHGRTAFRLPDDVPFEIVAPFGCGIQTGAGTVLNVLEPAAGSTLAVFGAGTVGISAMLAGGIAGCAHIVAVDVNPQRLALAAELATATTIDASASDPVEAIRELTGGGVDYAIDCTGVPTVLAQALAATAPLGTTAIVGSPPAGSTLPLDIIEMIVSGKRVLGAAEGHSVPAVFIPQLLEHWRAGRFPVDRLMQTFAFDDINEAIDGAHHGDVIKPVLVMV